MSKLQPSSLTDRDVSSLARERARPETVRSPESPVPIQSATDQADRLFGHIGKYELPGGNLDFGEEIFASVERETLEETGLKVKGKKVIAYTNDIQKEEDKHEVTLYVLCEREDASQQPEVSGQHPTYRGSRQ